MSKVNLNIIERFGDVDPVTHGGGVIHEFDGRFNWEYTYGLGEGINQQGNQLERDKCIVYATQIEKKIPSWVNSKRNISAIESFADVKISEMDENTSWLEWANLYQSIGQYFGMHNFDETPWKFEEKELNERWKLNE